MITGMFISYSRSFKVVTLLPLLCFLLSTTIVVSGGTQVPTRSGNTVRGKDNYRMARKSQARTERGLQLLLAQRKGGKGGMKYVTDYDGDYTGGDYNANDYWEIGEAQEVFTDEGKEDKGKDGKGDDDSESVDEKDKGKDNEDENEVEISDEGNILSAIESQAPSTSAPIEPETTQAPETSQPTFEPTVPPTPFIALEASAPTQSPVVQDSETPTFAPSEITTLAHVDSEPDSTSPPQSPPPEMKEDDDKGEQGSGIFDGQDYYHLHLIPFAVSVEVDEVGNDLGITSCLLTEMQKRNLSNLFNIEMENFTIVQFNDEDGDGFKRFDLYFAGFGELAGLPEYSEDYFQSVQMDVLGDGVEFFQTCLNKRWGDSGKTFTASSLDHDQAQIDAMQGNEVGTGEDGEEEENKQLRTKMIIGLSVAAVVVALCGMLIASRVLRGGDGAYAPASGSDK